MITSWEESKCLIHVITAPHWKTKELSIEWFSQEQEGDQIKIIINISLFFQAGRDKLYLIKKLKHGMSFPLDPITTD